MEINKNEWTEAERVANLPAVNELLQGFADDPTGDNGTMVVREVMRAVAQQVAFAPAHAAQIPAPPFPERDLTKPAEQQGIFRKFDVRRVDGSDQPGGKHQGCRFYVLDLSHDQHAPAAMRAYAAACATTHPELAADIEREFGAERAVSPAESMDDPCEPDLRGLLHELMNAVGPKFDRTMNAIFGKFITYGQKQFEHGRRSATEELAREKKRADKAEAAIKDLNANHDAWMQRTHEAEDRADAAEAEAKRMLKTAAMIAIQQPPDKLQQITQELPWSTRLDSETVTLNFSFADDILGALFNGDRINPEAFERTRQAFAAIMRGEKVFCNDGQEPDWNAYAQAEAASATDAGNVPHTKAGFVASFTVANKRAPTDQEIFSAGMHAGRDLERRETAQATPEGGQDERAVLARQIIQDTNDTLREQSEAMLALKAENDQLRAALAASQQSVPTSGKEGTSQ